MIAIEFWLAFGAVFSVAMFLTLFLRSRAKTGIERAAGRWKARVAEGMYAHGDRSDALHELREMIHADPWYAGLRRLTGIAPLVGVLISAAAFWLLGQPQSALGESDAGSVLQQLRPAFAGVVIGAVWAIVNQVIVLRVDRCAELTAADAVEASDSARIGSTYAVLGPFISQLGDFGRAIEQSHQALISAQEQFMDKLSESLERCVDAGTRLGSSSEAAAQRLEASSEAHFTAMGRVTKEYVDSVARLAKSIGSLDEKITLYLRDASDANQEANAVIREALAETRSMVGDARTELGRAMAALGSAAETEVQAVKSIAVAAADESTEAIRHAMAQLATATSAGISSLRESVTSQQRTVGDAIAESLRHASQQLVGSSEGLRTASGALSDSVTALDSVRSEVASASAAVRDQCSRTADVAEAFRIASTDLRQRELAMGWRTESDMVRVEEAWRRFMEWAGQSRQQGVEITERVDRACRRLEELIARLPPPASQGPEGVR